MGTVTPEFKEAQMEVVESKPKVVVITEDYGGAIFDYISKYNDGRRNGTKYQITDFCLSACTLLLGLVPKENVCVEKTSVFGFHSAWIMTLGGPAFHQEATRLIWNSYPHYIQDLLRVRGWDGDSEKEHPNFIYIRGTELYPECVNA